ncbi:MAG: TolB family protein [Bryobacteraceae bacterium]
MKRSSYLVTALALILAAVAVFVARRERPRAALRLAPIEKSALVRGQVPLWDESFVPSPDFQHVAWAEATPHGERIVVDGKPGREFEEVRTISGQGRGVLSRLPIVVFAPRGGRFAYGAKARGVWRLVVDGAEEGNWDRLGHLEFSSDGRRYAYSFERAGQRWVSIGGKEFGPYDPPQGVAFDFWLTPFFSPDGNHVAWTGRRGGKVFGVLDGKEDAPVAGRIGMAEFSADSTVFAYSVAQGGDHTWIVRKGGTVQRLEHAGDFRFAPEGARYAYTVREGNSYRLFTDRGETGPCASGREFWWDSPGALSYVNGSAELIYGDRRWPAAGRLLQVSASSDRKQVLWIARDGTQDRVFLDGREIAKGKKAAWACFAGARQMPWIAMEREDGSELQYGGAVDPSRYTEVGPVVRSGQGGRAACQALANTGTPRKPVYATRVLEDGQPLGELPSAEDTLMEDDQIQFTADGRHMACLVAASGTVEVLLVDGKEAIRKRGFLYAREDPALRALLTEGTMFLALKTQGGASAERLRELLPEGQEAARLALISTAAPEMGIPAGWELSFFQRAMQARGFAIGADGILTGLGLEETEKQLRVAPIWLDLSVAASRARRPPGH